MKEDKTEKAGKNRAREPRRDNTFTAILKFVPLIAFIVMVVVFGVFIMMFQGR